MAHRKVVLCLLGAALATSMISGCSGKKSDPVTVTVWTYYNGDQLDAFNDLTEKFNDTVGKKDGITVETKSLGTAEDLEQNVLAAVNGEVGASEVPNIFSAYSDTAYTMDQKDMLVDLSDYLTDKEKDEYVEEYLKEGDFSDDGSINISRLRNLPSFYSSMIQTGRNLRRKPVLSMRISRLSKALWKLQRSIITGRTVRLRRQMTEKLCSEEMPWRTIFW